MISPSLLFSSLFVLVMGGAAKKGAVPAGNEHREAVCRLCGTRGAGAGQEAAPPNEYTAAYSADPKP